MEYRIRKRSKAYLAAAAATAWLSLPGFTYAGDGILARFFLKPQRPCISCPTCEVHHPAPVEQMQPVPVERQPEQRPERQQQPPRAPDQPPRVEPEVPEVPEMDQSLLDLAATADVAAASGFAAPNIIGDFFAGVTPSIDGTARFFLSGDFRAIFVDAVDNGPVAVDPLFGSSSDRLYTHPLGGEIIIVDRSNGSQFSVIHNYPGATDGLEEEAGPVGSVQSVGIMSTQSDFDFVAGVLQQYVPGATLIQLDYSVDTLSVLAGSNSGLVDLAYDGSGTIDVRLPIFFVLPAGGRPGASIAQLKVSENNNVLPQDRFIFNYNYFNSVPLNADGVDINRFSPGFEKTFLNGLMSVQMVFPFASTLQTDMFIGATSKAVEFGNVQTIVKTLLYNSDRFKFGAGMGIESPTANDMSVGIVNGPTLLQLKNDSFHLQPYFGGIYLPTERTFIQTFVQFDIDVNGNRVMGNPDLNGLRDFGTLYSLPLFLWDTQMGYWFYRSEDPSAIVSSIAGMIEFHWNTTLASEGGSLEFEGLRASNLLGDFSIFNMTVGTTIGIGEQTQMLVGTVFPLSDDRSFDYEFAVYLNHYFGRSARDRGARTPSLF